jgi:hypothetical protein
MKLTRVLLSLSLAFSLSLVSFLAIPIQAVRAQDGLEAVQRGYRTGYSDGYMAGYRDSIDSLAKDLSRHSEYGSANRAYNKEYGSKADYSDGYRQGFEFGYDTGFEKRSFDSAIPADLARRDTPVEAAVSEAPAAAEPALVAPSSEPTLSDTPSEPPPGPAISTQKVSFNRASGDVLVIPQDTEMIVELQNDLGTEKNKEGDKFTAKVVSPEELSGAMIEGRIDKIQRPGRIKRRSELSLSFDRIVLSDERWSNFNALLSEVIPAKGDNVRRVDSEGTAVGKSSVKSDTIKVGTATGTGAAIGAVTGGPVGAAVGAGVGAAFGVGAVVFERGKHVRLNQNQQLRIRTSYETRVR